jgi:CRISPR-associated protein Cas1
MHARRPFRHSSNQGPIMIDIVQSNTTSLPNQTAADASPSLSDLPDMIPVRMLNEFTYCPRLGYLEWVNGEWADNLETMEGTFGHRRVDQPSTKHVPAADATKEPEQDATKQDGTVTPIHTRSLTLSAPNEGLLARLDLLELEGLTATPVDYKRGKAPDIPEGAWEPERVQLCAQALILRENGFQCSAGVLYFIASKKRVTIDFTPELIARTRQLRDEFRSTAARGLIPPPLIDSPKCPRCSLVGICLPDETHLLQLAVQAEAASDAAAQPDAPDEGTPNRVRRLIPANDDALPLYVQTQGAMVGKSGDRLTIKLRDEVLAERRLMDVSQVCLYGNVLVTAQALRELTTRGIPICHYTYGGWFHGHTTGMVHNNVELRIRQYAIAADPEKSLAFARAWIRGKIRNCRTLLRRHTAGLANNSADENTPDPMLETVAELPGTFDMERRGQPEPDSANPERTRRMLLQSLADYRTRVARVESAESLLGLEGMAAKCYFQGFFDLLRGRHEFDVTGRNRRPPRDPVNAVLSFVYSMLIKELTIVLQSVGFDPMLGFFHRPRFGRPGLALDCSEEYRPLIGDSVTLMVFNNGEVDHGSFLERAGAVTLTEAGRRAVIAAYERRMAQEVTHPIFGYRLSYRRVLEVQARLLARAVTGELPEYTPFSTR